MLSVSGKGICSKGVEEIFTERGDAFQRGMAKCVAAACVHEQRYSGRLACCLVRNTWREQPSLGLTHACVQLPYVVRAVGVAGECSDIHELSASCFSGLVLQEDLLWGW